MRPLAVIAETECLLPGRRGAGIISSKGVDLRSRECWETLLEPIHFFDYDQGGYKQFLQVSCLVSREPQRGYVDVLLITTCGFSFGLEIYFRIEFGFDCYSIEYSLVCSVCP